MSDPQASQQAAMQKAALLQSVSQLDMLIGAFGNAPQRVKDAAEEFKEALKEWATNG